MNTQIKSYLHLSLAMIIVGSSVVVGKLISNTLPIFLSSFLSLLIASILFLPTIIPLMKSKQLSKNDYFYLGLQGLLGTVLYRIFFFLGLKYIDASFAGILSAFQPAMISVLAISFLKEKQSLKEKFGIGLAVVGLILAYFANKVSVTINPYLLIGTVLVLLAVLGEACFSVFAKKLNKQISPMAIAGMVTLISCVMSFPTALYDIFYFDITTISLFGFSLIVYYGVFLTYIAFILWFSGLKYVKASVAGVFTAIVPISGILLSIIFLRESPNFFELIGGLLIIVSIILVVYKNEE
ncbi:MAG: hypothetical protein A2770_04715 [Candidatus Levybacteria bacterium RIFCSPHIGHO2_01_FULL_38_12]|uniref:EamA domain-containing protein n=1 Tax=Candidatus Portnoybacteria bacterium RIFCSPLOWO2_02_FULL_40_15 TaxID=1802002 RepID=A0A1G2FS54_9BACT|nr:MAG: hypothetical protein A2770_04715 [Candidatus Levybacteria bacterium RIFCSPHIGHO2_01_FULL_38_12]OGZ40371.1 MAG: hypothetical protein A3I20_01950 [Candidatus Portnoybacteria bacterium RIFCSPLOWO2_02_FULL_40_15]